MSRFIQRLKDASLVGFLVSRTFCKDIELVAIGGNRKVIGLNNLTNGELDNPEIRESAIAEARQSGYIS